MVSCVPVLTHTLVPYLIIMFAQLSRVDLAPKCTAFPAATLSVTRFLTKSDIASILPRRCLGWPGRNIPFSGPLKRCSSCTLKIWESFGRACRLGIPCWCPSITWRRRPCRWSDKLYCGEKSTAFRPWLAYQRSKSLLGSILRVRNCGHAT
jgi:hypothetical protein